MALLAVIGALAAIAIASPVAQAGSTIDTTGFAGNTSFPFTRYLPLEMDVDGSDVAQTFLAPASTTTITEVAAILSATPSAQPAKLSLWTANDSGPLAEMATTNVVIPAGSGLREFPVSWAVTGGARYAFVFSIGDADVVAEAALRLPNVGGADARNVYADGLVYTRNPGPPTWNGDPVIDVKFRIKFDGGATVPDPTPTPPPAPAPAPAAQATPAPAAPAAPKLPSAALALRAAKGKKSVAASFACSGATLATCAAKLIPPKGARSVTVQVLRGTTLIADAAVGRAALAKGGKRTLRLKARAALAAGLHVVKLTIVTGKGKKITQTATFGTQATATAAAKKKLRPFRDGRYTFKSAKGARATLTVSGGGKKVKITFPHFGGGILGEFPYCEAAVVDHGTYTLRRDPLEKTKLAFSDDGDYKRPVQAIETDGKAGGGSTASGTIDPKKLTISGQFGVKMFGVTGGNYTCLENPTVVDAKLTRAK